MSSFFPWIDADSELSIAPPARTSSSASDVRPAVASLIRAVADGYPAEPTTSVPTTLFNDVQRAAAQLEENLHRIPVGQFRFVSSSGVIQGDSVPSDDGFCDPDFVNECRARTGTVVILGLERIVPDLWQLLTEIDEALGVVAGVTLFVSSPNFRGFPCHYDVMHSLLFQLQGEKSWRTSPGPVRLPATGHDWPAISHLYEGTELRCSGDGVREFPLSAGDELWIPTGWLHEGMSSDSGSTHATLAIQPPRWFDLLRHIADSADFLPSMRNEIVSARKHPRSVVEQVLSEVSKRVSDLSDERLGQVMYAFTSEFSGRGAPSAEAATEP